jgi:hypothetical protein
MLMFSQEIQDRHHGLIHNKASQRQVLSHSPKFKNHHDPHLRTLTTQHPFKALTAQEERPGKQQIWIPLISLP